MFEKSQKSAKNSIFVKSRKLTSSNTSNGKSNYSTNIKERESKTKQTAKTVVKLLMNFSAPLFLVRKFFVVPKLAVNPCPRLCDITSREKVTATAICMTVKISFIIYV